MKLKALLLIFIMTFTYSFSASASTYIEWTAFGPTYQSASFSFITEPIVVSSNDIRKMNYSTLPICKSLEEANLPEVDCIKSIEATTNGKDWLIGTSASYIQVRQQVIDSPPTLAADWARKKGNGWLIQEELAKNIPGSQSSLWNYLRQQAIDSPPSITAEWASKNIDLNQDEYQDRLSNNIAGSRSSLWTFPGMTHKNGSQFLVSYQIGTPVYNNKLNFEESLTEIKVQPVEISLTGTPPGPDEKLSFSSWRVDSKQCFSSSKVNYCISFYPFDDTNLRFRFTVNLTNAAESLSSNTWMYTHSLAPYIQQNRVPKSATSQEIILELSPTAIQIPTIVLDSENSVTNYVETLLPPLPDDYPSGTARTGYEIYKKGLLDRYLSGIGLNEGNYTVTDSKESFTLGSTYLMSAQDKFISPKNTKEFIGLRVQIFPLESTLRSGDLYQTLKSCPSTFGIAGIISSNATAIETYPPILDKWTKTLKYRVAAPHLKQNGGLNSGFYRLQLNPQVAKCIWGENLFGAKAEVSIVNDDGEVQVTTATFSFNNEAAIFEVSGFHYSAGTINVKLLVPSAAKPNSRAAATSSKTATITCVKGKVTKKVTALKPKCPAGYKKK